jgi:hypothetical protein
MLLGSVTMYSYDGVREVSIGWDSGICNIVKDAN